MNTTLQSIIDEFSQEDQERIHSKARVLAQEMIRHADSLAEVRNALVKTQEDVARVLNVKQNAIAQLEKRSDLLISTLRRYVEAMGGELALAIKTGAGSVIMLDGLSSISKPSSPLLARPRASARKHPALAASKTKAGKVKATKGRAAAA